MVRLSPTKRLSSYGLMMTRRLVVEVMSPAVDMLHHAYGVKSPSSDDLYWSDSAWAD